MTQNSNQFQITNEKGTLTLVQNINVVNAIVDVDETATLVPGDAVKIKDVSGKTIKVEKATALTDDVFGFVPFDFIKNEYVLNESLKVAFNDSVMIMEASAAIAAGAQIQFDPATAKVATLIAPNTKIGFSLDKAAADGDLVRVLIKTPGSVTQDLDGLTASVAELNKLDTSAETETIDSGVAADAAKRITQIDNTTSGAGAITLAAPDASMLGLTKTIEMTVDGGDVTLALTNVQGGSAATTATFADVGDTLVLTAGATKWTVTGEGGVVLS